MAGSEQQGQIIEDSTGQKLYKLPKYITENHNGDVIVSDLNNGVVVTDRTRRHRFPYTGPHSGSGFSPLGVCVDALSNILVSNAKSKKIQMIDRDGNFLSLFNKIKRINVSGGLAYDSKNHILLVGTTYYNSRKSQTQRERNIPATFAVSLNDEINKTDLIKLLGKEIQITETKMRESRIEQLLELMPEPLLKESFILGMASRHISCATKDMLWISGPYEILLANRKGDILDAVTNAKRNYGGHSVTREGDLIYIDGHNNIKRMPTYNKIPYTLIKNKYPMKAESVYCSPSTADLLVGIVRYDENKCVNTDAKVMRYGHRGKQIQVIEHNDKGRKLYKFPAYITEKHNEDVIVSDLNKGVVVTDRTGRHRFSYTGSSSLSRLSPLGVCVDALSNILVSDAKSKTIQMIDKDGHFLSIFTKKHRINVSGGLDYDNKNHLLLVGTTDYNSRLCVYRYIKRKDYLADDLNG
ncbi:uncharacterized protein LOC134235729 [Saccostrea cucullata]|uniref:uncharacterized protein LOC134235729 n=1 Tax=Saccostrea cuccullata TaxID=36930 RepID=UPI002ED4BD4D